MVHLASSTQEFKDHISKDQYTVVDFYTTWCGPCKAIAPVVASLSQKYPAINFVKVDVDDQLEVATAESITVMPTFVVYKNGKRLDCIMGARQDKLEDFVAKYAKLAEQSC